MVLHLHRHHCADDSLLLPGNRRVGDSAHHPIGISGDTGNYSHGRALECHGHLACPCDVGADPNTGGAAHNYQHADARPYRYRNKYGHTHSHAHGHHDGYPDGDINLYAGTDHDFYTTTVGHFYTATTAADRNFYADINQHANTND